ncbi:MAG: bifunctional UDP-N-acetylglucosamine diphosphorylase/glucosamine-1-phosphate N-acetyltransferase GlmU [Clostridiales bacterium]|nr:bifunctional UDP-N-acetylglucosamine diphosphorylase/glucosamine-1-phosphate N-acetyltransferase GlmU [Clostridiales bacterium]MCD7828225.1 bifunctional UDP-N-acetylglucosamine diphosphorylase/glucosamine-1-phosphate N-acetyltransferase GlmU [Clostridiales bacterium]
MKNCIVIISDCEYCNEKVLFKPMIHWVVSAAEETGVDYFLSSDISSFDDINGYENAVILRGDAPFIESKTVINALNFHIENKNAVTVIESESSELHAYCINCDAFSAFCPKAEGFGGIAEYAENLSGEKGAYRAGKKELLTARTKKELNRLNETARRDMLERLLDEGVEIPCIDGIIVSPDCKIGVNTVILPNTIICGKTSVGEDCVIGPNSYAENAEIGSGVKFNNSQIRNAKILNGCDIGPFAQIRPDSVIGDNVHLGNFTEVKNSVIDTGTKVSHLTYVGDSDVGKNVNFGCGVVTVNYTGKSKHRTTIKDGAFIGCNTNLVAPVTVGENSYTAAGSTITEDVPDNSLGIARERQTNKIDWVKRKQPYKKKV